MSLLTMYSPYTMYLRSAAPLKHDFLYSINQKNANLLDLVVEALNRRLSVCTVALLSKAISILRSLLLQISNLLWAICQWKNRFEPNVFPFIGKWLSHSRFKIWILSKKGVHTYFSSDSLKSFPLEGPWLVRYLPTSSTLIDVRFRNLSFSA